MAVPFSGTLPGSSGRSLRTHTPRIWTLTQQYVTELKNDQELRHDILNLWDYSLSDLPLFQNHPKLFQDEKIRYLCTACTMYLERAYFLPFQRTMSRHISAWVASGVLKNSSG